MLLAICRLTHSLFCFFFCVAALLGLVCGQVNISFVLQTGNAQWPARYWANVESYPKAVSGNGNSLPANSLILFGGTGTGGGHQNDVWGSSDMGRTWVMLANEAYTGTRFPGYAIDSQARLYKVAGGDTSQVWMSTNGSSVTRVTLVATQKFFDLVPVYYMLTRTMTLTHRHPLFVILFFRFSAVTWTQQMPGSQATTLPPRYLHDVQVDGKDALFVVGGLSSGANDGGMNDGTSSLQLASSNRSNSSSNSSSSVMSHLLWCASLM